MSSIRLIRNGSVSTVQAQDGVLFLDVLRTHQIPMNAPCGGAGTCGKCRVMVEQDSQRRTVLACQTRVSGDCSLILDAFDGGEICAEAAATPVAFQHRPGYGAAIDLGTTTVAVTLFDLSQGKNLGTKSAWSAQAPYGADVITRTQYIMEHPEGLNELSHLIRAQIGGLIQALCQENGVAPEMVTEAALAGNTIMQHIFAGLSPAGIAVAPFTTKTLFDHDETLRIPELPGTVFTMAPCVAGYVGGDIVSGLLASKVLDSKETALFLDIGTNGEMALCTPQGVLCCAVASGPAFEGAEISCGMSSADGAISHFRWDGRRPVLEVIGGKKPVGICGSGLVDLLAELLRIGVVDSTGRLLPPEEAPRKALPWLGEDENENGVFYLTPDRSIAFTAGDVRKLQLAKAAVAAGIEVLLNKAGLEAGQVSRVLLAGGFGTRISPDSAAAIGMIPAPLAQKTESIGNSSLSGMQQVLLDPAKRDALLSIQQACRYLELSGSADFSDAYLDHMMFDEEE